MANGPTMRDEATYIQAGIDPKTGKAFRELEKLSKTAINQQLRVLDEQDAVNRYTWYGLPNNISSQELERLLYYKGQLAFFYFEPSEEFLFLPFTLTNKDSMALDWYGRYKYITPIPIAEGATDDEKKNIARLRTLLQQKQYKVNYGIHLGELNLEDLTNSAVIIRDYTNQLPMNITPRQILNDKIIDLESNCIPYMTTALKNGTGIEGIRVGNPDESSNVYAANRTLDIAALTGDKFVPISGGLEFQELVGGNLTKTEEFLLAMQGVDNYRLSLYGIDNGGVFQKKAHMLEAEQEANNGIATIPLQDGLTQRRNFCDIANSIWGLGIWCEIAEPILGIDRNGDGESSENEPAQPSYENEQTEGQEELTDDLQ